MFTWFELDQNLTPSYFVASPLYNQNNSLAENTMSNFGNKIAVGFKWYAATQSTVNVNGTILKANDKNTSFPTRYSAPYNAVGTDIAICQFDRTLQGSSTNISENKNLVVNFSTYPNPANDVINIKLDNDLIRNSSITISNLLGEIILTEEVITDNYSVNTSNLNSGIYFINLIYQGKQITKKIIIE